MKFSRPAQTLGVVLAGVLLTGMAGGCGPQLHLPNMIQGDWHPPVLSAVTARSANTIALEFDEPVTLTQLTIDPEVEIRESRWQNGALEVEGVTPFTAGVEYWLDLWVEDGAGNVSSILAAVYGLNESLPEIQISEFVCEGSSSHPDWVELELLSDGNIGGLCLYEGSPGIWDSRKTLPAVDLPAGAFIVVHFKPEVIPAECDELVLPSESGGKDAHPNAWDFWVNGGDGIPNSTGALTVTAYPDGPILDAVLYTTKRYDPNDPKLGFGLASQLEIFQDVVERGGWTIAGESVIPEDGLNPEDSTATRSICRDPGQPDTDSAADWHITPTSGASPGYVNTTERYQP
ncbi:MAG: hypothetical protein WCY01_04040 [Alkalispirochaeta sp.]